MKVLGLEDDMPFGKYEGEQIEDLIEDHPHYVKWLVEDTDTQFDEETMELITKKGIV